MALLSFVPNKDILTFVSVLSHRNLHCLHMNSMESIDNQYRQEMALIRLV